MSFATIANQALATAGNIFHSSHLSSAGRTAVRAVICIALGLGAYSLYQHQANNYHLALQKLEYERKQQENDYNIRIRSIEASATREDHHFTIEILKIHSSAECFKLSLTHSVYALSPTASLATSQSVPVKRIPST